MSATQTTIHPNREAREKALQFLYQCEIEKLYYFPAVQFKHYLEAYPISASQEVLCSRLIKGVFAKFASLNEKIREHSKNWSVERMPVVDRCILRLACFELMDGEVKPKIIINEAIELAKKYSTDESGRFINAILDRVYKELSSTE